MGANVKVKIRQTPSLLTIAVSSRDLEMVTFLCNLNSISLDEGPLDYYNLNASVLANPFPQAIMAQILRKASPRHSQDLLLLAINSNRATAVAYLAEVLDATCFDGALELAVTKARLSCLDSLLSSGKADPNARNAEGALALHAACALGALPIVKRLYAVTTTSHVIYASGDTPLHLASNGGHAAVVEFLIKNGADINAMSRDRQTPLQSAIKNGKMAVRELLLENGARLDLVEESAGALPDAHRMMRRSYSFEPLFDGGGMEVANPLQSGNVLNDFDWDSVLRDLDRNNNAF